MRTFLKKLVIALILAPPFIWLWWKGEPFFSAVMTVFVAVAAYETVAMGATEGRLRAAIIGVAGALGAFLPVAFPVVPWSSQEAIFFALVAAFCVHLLAPGDMSSAANRVSVIVFAVVYASLPISYLVMLRNTPTYGLGLSFLVLISAWACDTFAYVGGRLLGRHKLYPRMSPNKTVEGLFAGMLASAVAVAISTRAFALPFSIPSGFGLGLCAGFVGQVGDLSESLLKRSFGVKDAGKLLGEHGGVLDRFDAVLFVGPLVYYVWRFLP